MTMNLTNPAFGAIVGIDTSYASYLRNGRRIPSAALLIHIIKQFDLNPTEAMDAFVAGRECFGEYLRDTVFEQNPEELPVRHHDLLRRYHVLPPTEAVH